MVAPRLAIPVGKKTGLISDETLVSIIHKCLPIILKIAGVNGELDGKLIYFVKEKWLVFPFSVHRAVLPVLKLALLELFPADIDSDAEVSTQNRMKSLNAQLDEAVKAHTEEIAGLMGKLASVNYMIMNSPPHSVRFKQTSDEAVQLKSKMEELKSQHDIRCAALARQIDDCQSEGHVFILHRCLEESWYDAGRSYRPSFARRFRISKTQQSSTIHVVSALPDGCLIKSVEELEEEDPQVTLRIPPAFMWFWEYMKMMSLVCKPTSPLNGVFDYTRPCVLSRNGMIEALASARYDHREMEQTAPGCFRKKHHGDDQAFVDACVEYMNRALFMVCEGNVQFGILKYTAEGAPLFDLKGAKGVEDEFRPLHVSIVSGKSHKARQVYLFDLWKDSAAKNCVKKMIWVPWGGWPCSMIKEMNGLDYKCMNSYLGYRYSLQEMATAYNTCDPQLLLDVKRIIFNNLCGADAVQYTYVVKFLARALQLPFCKQGAFLMFVGASGIGKGTILLAVGHILGQSFYHNKAGEIAKDFNSDFLNRSLIFFDEMHIKKDSYSWLKTAITEPTQRIEEKYKTAQDMPSFWSCIGASNDIALADSVIDATDRRFYFADCMKTKSPVHAKLAESVGRQMSANNFLLNKAFGYWLLNIDVSDFDASKIPLTRASKVTQQRSENSAVYVFLADCLQTKTLLPSPGNEFLRLHNYLQNPGEREEEDDNNEAELMEENDVAEPAGNDHQIPVRSEANFSNGLPALDVSISVASDESGVWNPLNLSGERLEKWKRWYRVDTDSYLIDLPCWKFMKKRHKQLDAHSNVLDTWMVKGGWLSVIPCAQLYNRFIRWCKTNGINTQKWTSSVFSCMFQEAMGPGAVKFQKIGSEIVQFYEIGSYSSCQAFFSERFPVFKCAEQKWSSQREILDPPTLPLAVLEPTFVEKLEHSPAPSPLVSDFVKQLKAQCLENAGRRQHSDDVLDAFLVKPRAVSVENGETSNQGSRKLKRKYEELKETCKSKTQILKAKESTIASLRQSLEEQSRELETLKGKLKAFDPDQENERVLFQRCTTTSNCDSDSLNLSSETETTQEDSQST